MQYVRIDIDLDLFIQMIMRLMLGGKGAVLLDCSYRIAELGPKYAGRWIVPIL